MNSETANPPRSWSSGQVALPRSRVGAEGALFFSLPPTMPTQSFTALLLCPSLFRQTIPAAHPQHQFYGFRIYPDRQQSLPPLHALLPVRSAPWASLPSSLPSPLHLFSHKAVISPGALVSLTKLTIPILVPLDSLKNLPLISNFENFIRRSVMLERNRKFSFVTWLFCCL